MVVERIKEFMESRGMTVSAFEKAVGVGNATFSKAFKKGSWIGTDKLEMVLSAFPELSPRWVLTGEGSMISSEDKRDRQIDEHALPLIPFEAVAGPGRPIYEDERIGEYYYVSEFKECDFLIRVKGDSMAPHFVGGDLLACRKVVDAFFFQWGRCYVVYTRSQGVMVKRVQPSEKEGWITCVSDNPKYAPFDVPLEDVVSVALVNGSISLE